MRVSQKLNIKLTVVFLLIINLIIRLIIYYNTELFSFSDYSAYLNSVDKIKINGSIYLLQGNYLYAISYLGYYAKYILGNLDYFFLFNCFLGTLSSLFLFLLVEKLTGNALAGFFTILIHTVYTEFMVFSSVFYTPVIMIFLLSSLLLVLYKYFTVINSINRLFYFIISIIIFMISFFFKEEFKYIPYFIIILSVFLLRTDMLFVKKSLNLGLALVIATLIFNLSNIITKPEGHIWANDFNFFGHTDYGGNGGEGSFIYPENENRYDLAFANYMEQNNIKNPDRAQINTFHKHEIIKFITNHPFKWINLQLTKFFRTFGVVPESSSFKILYTGLLNERLWLTALIVVIPIPIIILLFIQLFNFSAFQLFSSSDNTHPAGERHFMYIYLLFFIYYLIAVCFYGHYQERYRLPVLVCFIIPLTSIFLANFNYKEYIKRPGIYLRSILSIIFITVWVFQAKAALSFTGRLNNAIEKAKESIEKIQ